MQGLFFARRIRQPPVRMPCVRISSRCMSSVAPLRSTARPLASPPPPPEASPLPGTPQPPGASALSPLMPHPQTQNGLAARLLLQPLFPRLAPLSSEFRFLIPVIPPFPGGTPILTRTDGMLRPPSFPVVGICHVVHSSPTSARGVGRRPRSRCGILFTARLSYNFYFFLTT